MADASASAAASTGQQLSGGSIIKNPSAWQAWIVAGVALLVLAAVVLKARKGKK